MLQPDEMNLRKACIAISGLSFALSFFLPSFETNPSSALSGFACLRICLSVFLHSGDGKNAPVGAWFYYSGFVAANFIFVLLFGATLFSNAYAGLRCWMSSIILLQVLSWLVVNVVTMEDGDHFSLKVGYFIWLLAFISLLCAQICRRDITNRSQDAVPA
jgi:hypothetical protein